MHLNWNSQFFFLVVKQGFDFQVSSGSVCVFCLHNPCTRNSSGASRSSRSRWVHEENIDYFWNKFYAVCMELLRKWHLVWLLAVFSSKGGNIWKRYLLFAMKHLLTGSCTSITISKVCESILVFCCLIKHLTFAFCKLVIIATETL